MGMEYLYSGQYGVTTDMNGLYYMRARYYDKSIKRFINRDVLSGDIGNSQSLNRFCYVQGNPVSLTDPFGLCPDGNGLAEVFMQQTASIMGFASSVMETGAADKSSFWHTALDLIGIVWDGADIINAVWYALEGNYAMATVSAICALPFVGSLVGGSAGMALKVIGHSLTFGMAAQGTWEATGKAVEAYQNGTFSVWNVLDVGLNALGMCVSGRAAFSEGRKLANRIAASEAGQKIAQSGSNTLDNRLVDNSFFDNGERVATTREIRRYKRQMQSMGINVVVDLKGKVLNGNRAAGFDYATGTIYIKKKAGVIDLYHEGFHAEQYLNIGKKNYINLERLEREEYVYSRIMDNSSLFNEVELAGATNYIARLRGRN